MGKTLKPKRSFEEKLPLLLAFILPILIMLGIFAGKEIYPFGENSFLRTDLYHQYVAFFENFAERVRDGGSLTYAFDIGLGSNYTALFAYYLCGPLHLLAFLIPEGYIIEFITYLIVLRIGFCGLSMAWYLSKRFDSRHIAITFCGVCYALSGYLAAYSWNIMWLDVLWLTPIVLYGLEQLVEKNKPFLYCGALGLAILCNYYISIMLCIFLVFYFICRMICLPKTNWKQILLKIFNFGFFSLLAGGLACVLVVPAAYALMGTASANTTFPKTITNYFSIFEMLSRHLVCVEVETGLDHWPNLYCGVGVFLFVPLYYMNRDVNYKEKLVSTLLIGFMLLGFNTNVLNYVWHGMHYPNSLPCRQSYLYNFVMLVMVFEGMRGLPKITKDKLLGTMWGAVGLILLMEKLVDPEEIEYYACYASILFVCLYAFFAYLHKTRRIDSITCVALTLCLLIVEMGLNTAVTSVSFVNRTSFVRYDDAYDELIAMADEDSGGEFYRMERYNLRTKNDGPYFGYNSASLFSSTTNSKISDVYKKLGLEGNTNAYAYTGATPFMSSLLGVKYIISDGMLLENPLFTKVGRALDHEGSYSYLYRYDYTLPLGFLMPKDTDRLWTTTSGSPVKVQNSLANVATGVGNLLANVDSKVNGASMTAKATADGYYYVYVTGSTSKVTAYVNNSNSKSWDSLGRGYLVRMGYLSKGDEIKVTNTEGSSISGTVYRFDTEKFIKVYEKLAANPFKVTEFTNTRAKTEIRGTVSAEKDSLLFFSIPYEECWKMTIDGKAYTPEALGNAFISAHVTSGKHTVVLTYEPQGLKLGALISAASLLLLLIIMLLSFVIGTLRKKKVSENAVIAADTAVSGRDRMALLHQLDEEERRRETGVAENQPADRERIMPREYTPAEKKADEAVLSVDSIFPRDIDQVMTEIEAENAAENAEAPAEEPEESVLPAEELFPRGECPSEPADAPEAVPVPEAEEIPAEEKKPE